MVLHNNSATELKEQQYKFEMYLPLCDKTARQKARITNTVLITAMKIRIGRVISQKPDVIRHTCITVLPISERPT